MHPNSYGIDQCCLLTNDTNALCTYSRDIQSYKICKKREHNFLFVDSSDSFVHWL